MHRLISVLIGAAALASFATPAIAGGGNSGKFVKSITNKDSSAAFQEGRWSFDKWPVAGSGWIGFNYSGRLKDSKADGDWVYTRGRIDGYDWAGGSSAENHHGYPTRVSVSQKVYAGDPPAEGKIQVCRHRTGIIPNICSESEWKRAAGT